MSTEHISAHTLLPGRQKLQKTSGKRLLLDCGKTDGWELYLEQTTCTFHIYWQGAQHAHYQACFDGCLYRGCAVSIASILYMSMFFLSGSCYDCKGPHLCLMQLRLVRICGVH